MSFRIYFGNKKRPLGAQKTAGVRGYALWEIAITIMLNKRIICHNVICQGVYNKTHGIGAAGQKDDVPSHPVRG